MPVSIGLGSRHNNAEPFELLEPLREQSARESGRALQNLIEVSAAKVEVADDERCPALGEDLRATSNRTILTVRPHASSIARSRSVVKYIFLTRRSWFAVV